MNRRGLLKAAIGSLFLPLVAKLPIPAAHSIKAEPEMWASESLAILEENMIMAAIVHRDFKYGT